ncbi:MAG: PHP domain-containing protein [Desulfomonile sp.]|nr:PHP domain-containing protein [Desulfomonile sp.]
MRIDLHNHTTLYSECSIMTPDQLMTAAKTAGLDAVCITEHGRIWSRDEAGLLADRHGIPVFRGIEITTTGGDIVVFGLEQEPDRMWTPAELKARVDAVGGVAIAAHPFRGFLVFGFGALEMDIDSAKQNPTFAHVHGLEVCNGLVTEQENEFARQVAESLGMLKLAGSDAHRPEAVGSCVTVFNDTIETEDQLVAAILSGRHSVERRQ